MSELIQLETGPQNEAQTVRIGIIICARYRDCGGGKCFRAMRERRGRICAVCGRRPTTDCRLLQLWGCPGGNVKYVPAEFLKNGAAALHLATGLVVGYPPCPHIRQFKAFIEKQYGLPVIVGTHPIPLKYLQTHQQLPFWEQEQMNEIAAHLLAESQEVMAAYS
ncbi:MAG: CGGC domain-containing protein [Bryobacteraceae bacterium]